MKKITLNKKQQELIERIGIFFEHQGLPPAVARISGLLLVSDRVELTFEEIHTTLNLSKSAASNAINILLKAHRLEYITKPGDRKRYFKLFIDHWETMFDDRLKFLPFMIALLKEIHLVRSPKNKEFNANLKEIIAFIEFMNKEIPKLFVKWKKKIKPF